MNDPCLSIMSALVAGLPSRYRVVRFIAQGGMGCVFEGHDANLDQRVAFKVLRRDLASAVTAERFRREGRVLARLNHPNIVRVFDSLETPNGLLVLVMEYVDGPTLQKVLRDDGRLPLDGARKFGSQLLRALQHAHDLSIIHRDIKPGNIFIRGSDALLGDFGIASVSDSDSGTLTADGSQPGTLLYMAPEQFRGVATRRSDIFSMGLVLRQCFTGVAEQDVRNPDKDAWRGLSLVKEVVERAAAEQPEERWQSAAAFRVALERTAQPLTARWRPALLAAAALVVVLALLRLRPPPLPLYTPQLNDLAILPFTGPAGRDVSQLVGEDIRPFPVIKLWNMAKAAAWWDSLPADKKDMPPPDTRFHASGSVTQSNGRFEARVEVDSAGVPYASIRATEDTAHLQQLARIVADSTVCKAFPRDCEDFMTLRLYQGDMQAIREFFKGRDSVAKGNWRAGQRHFENALRRDPGFMVAAWELMIAKRIRRENFSEDLQDIARNIDSLPPFYRKLARATLAPDLRERFRLLEQAVQESQQNGTALLLYTNELFHRGALVGKPLRATVDTMTALAATEPEMNHTSTYDMAWWGELRLGREDRAWHDLERRKALGPPPGDPYAPFQRLGTYARFSPWIANLVRFLMLRSPDKSTLESLQNFARLGNLMDIPEEQLALSQILVSKGETVPQRAAGWIGLAGGDLMLGRPEAALAELDSASASLGTTEMQLQQREWPVHLAALGLYFDSARVASARTWFETTPLQGRDRVRALYALGRDAIARQDTVRAAQVESQLRILGATTPSAMRHADLLNAELSAARGDAHAALQASEVIYLRDTTLVRLSPFARATTYLNRGKWQSDLGMPDSADAMWLWYESSDFEGWPNGPPQEGELDAILSVYARLLRGELEADRGNRTTACRHLTRVKAFWSETEPRMSKLRERARRAREKAGCP